MKKLLLTTVILPLFYMSGFSQTLNKETLCKKWYLEKHEVIWVDYETEENEKTDYMLLKSGMTYERVDEGTKTSGKWIFNSEKNYFTMYNNKGDDIKITIDELLINSMVLNIDIKEMDGLDIHYTTKK
jgi:hypothetical protein